ncbi:hypothetical protein UFOVP131_9 [uncultured Caudovirales phage]|uniref:Uncharacterized protein n=1 Tax=uncultured Caudovirales phage TaxID=2100421 RepID=A0A6J5LAS8_9CAUD|nr:hypothetical protein UFOVP131_9 [uncultured Caudovirales phage]
MAITLDAIIAAFVACKPYPAWLEVGEQTLTELIADREALDYLEHCRDGPPKTVSGIELRVRKYLVGWRVASLPPGSDTFLADAPADEYVRLERGQPKRMYVTSPDFDETEQLRYERYRRSQGLKP